MKYRFFSYPVSLRMIKPFLSNMFCSHLLTWVHGFKQGLNLNLVLPDFITFETCIISYWNLFSLLSQFSIFFIFLYRKKKSRQKVTKNSAQFWSAESDQNLLGDQNYYRLLLLPTFFIPTKINADFFLSRLFFYR